MLNSFIGKTCPYCQYPVKHESEVTVCPGCSIPHHRECWQENDGCTTFGCQGLSGGSYHSRGTAGTIGSNRIVIDDLSYENGQSNESRLKESITHTYSKASYGKRVGAFIIDNVIATTPFLIIALLGSTGMLDALVGNFGLLLLVPIYGTIIWPIFYFLTRDCFFKGQSPGKKMFDLMVVYLVNNRPCSIGLSFKRNLLIFILSPIEHIMPLFHNKGSVIC